MKNKLKKVTSSGGRFLSEPLKRRSFIRYTGLTTGAALFYLSGCKKDDDNDIITPTTPHAVDFGQGDNGILNYAYMLEQLEAAFYGAVVSNASFATTFSSDEQTILKDIRDHEIVHREFLKETLQEFAFGDLETDFSSIDLTNRQAVLEAAKKFEDTGVAAYNGVGNLFTDADILLSAGKIVSVEARHAAVIRDLINPKSVEFAGDSVVDASGLDHAMDPDEVLSAIEPYIKTKFITINLPKL